MIDKRQQLLETALKLFYSKGVQAVGINEVLKESGIAKKTLYHHFSSKEDLVLASLELRDKRFCSWFEGLIEGATDNEDLVTRLFTGLSQWFNNEVPQLDEFRGCFFINTSGEFSNSEGAISSYCKTHKENIRKIIARHLVEPDEALVDCLWLLKEGAIVLAYVSQDKDAGRKALTAALGYVAQRRGDT